MLAIVTALPGSEPTRPVAAEVVGDVAIATIGCAAASWSGMDGAAPAVAGAHELLVAAARAGERDRPAMLLRAFAAASARIDAAAKTKDACPAVSLTCAVATRDSVVVAWIGGMIACLLHGRRTARESTPHTVANEMLADPKATPADLECLPGPFLNKVARSLGASHVPDPRPEIATWPALQRGDRLVLALPDVIAALRRRAPLWRPGARSWLDAAVTRCPVPRYRFAAMLGP